MQQDRTTVLYIEDDVVVLCSRKRLLELAGYSVLGRTFGTEGLDSFRYAKVDLIVLDHHMPDMDGGDTASEIKKINSTVPIIMFSALPKLPDNLLHMVEAFVQKGSPIEELISKIKEVLGRYGAPHL